jgi:hypothetical protein
MFYKCDQFPNLHVPGSISNFYFADKSGSKTYQFNSLGFRSEEFNSNAQFKFFVFGPSSSFVTGLNIDETYGYQLKTRIAKDVHCSLNDINFMNFAVAGVSTDYSVRNLINQCSEYAPDFLVLDLSHPSRMEWVSEHGTGVPFGSGIPNTPMSYFQFYEDELGVCNLLKNLLLMQSFCQLKNIDYIVLNSVYDFNNLPKRGPLAEYFEKINNSHVLNYINVKALDHAADTKWNEDGSFKWLGHLGPESNKHMAEQIYQKYQALQSE